MKLKSNTLLLILGILFVLIAGLSYFFYTKYKSTMEYVNKQLNLKLGQYDFNLKKQLGEMMEQYKNYLTQDKPIYKNPEEQQVVENLLSELQDVNEEDLQFDDTTQLTRQLETIQGEIINEEHVTETLEVEEALENMVQEIENPQINFEEYAKQDEEVEEIAEELSEEEIANLVSSEDFVDIIPSDDELADFEDDDLPFITSDDEDEEEDTVIETEDDDIVEEEVEEVVKEVVSEPETIDSLECEECDLDDFVIEEKKVDEDRCIQIMGRGKRKGKACGKKVYENCLCKKHSGKYKK